MDDNISRFPGAAPRSARLSDGPGPGQLEMVVTHLEMLKPPPRRRAGSRAERTAIMRARRPTVSFYRYLYNTVGESWMWYERRRLCDQALAEIINDDEVEIYVLYVDGVPAGYVELDARVESEVEVAYFGLVPEFVGRGLGQYFLDWAVERAWSATPRRVWVHTCNFDHPGAIAVYQKAGFVPCHQERFLIDDPRPELFAAR